MDTDLTAAIAKLKVDPDLRSWLEVSRHFGCTIEEAKFRYDHEKAFRETVDLLRAEAEIKREEVLMLDTERLAELGAAFKVATCTAQAEQALIADGAAQNYRYRRGS